jgi:hypothetical protein
MRTRPPPDSRSGGCPLYVRTAPDGRNDDHQRDRGSREHEHTGGDRAPATNDARLVGLGGLAPRFGRHRLSR